MKFVIDTNILMSALIKDSYTREILLYSGFDFYYPEVSFKEVEKHKKMILDKSGLNQKKFEKLILILFKKIRVVPTNFFSEYLKNAEQIMGGIDINDAVFVALALALKIPIWSEDSHFDRQTAVKNFRSLEISKTFLKRT